MDKAAIFCAPALTSYGECTFDRHCSMKLDAEKRLALQEEKQELETKLLEM